MKSKKGFTLVEIIAVIGILIIIAGLFAVNMAKTLNRNKEEENKSMINVITSAADAYVSSNPNKIEDLYNGYGFVDITVGELRDAGLLSDNLKNAETGETVSDDEKVRATLKNGDFVNFEFVGEVSSTEVISWNLFAEDLHISYDSSVSSNSWCNNNSNIFTGLIEDTSSNYSDITSKLYLQNNKGEMYSGSYESDGINLRKTSCNVNPQMAGTYQITYSYKDPLNIEKTAIRKVIVGTSVNDVASFTAIINPNESGVSQKVVKGSSLSDVKIKIIEYKRDGTSNELDVIAINQLNGYTLSDFDTSTSGTKTATVISTKTNSDGSRPESVNVSYTVSDLLVGFIEESGSCTTTLNDKYISSMRSVWNYNKQKYIYQSNYNTNCYYEIDNNGNKVYSNSCYDAGCYYIGVQEHNYVKYNGYLYRIYYKTGDYIGLIYNNKDINHPYGQLGHCTNYSCCNSGRYMYTKLGDSVPDKYKNKGFVDTMDTILSNFYINKYVDSKYIQSRTVNNKSSKISLLTLAEYKKICGYDSSSDKCSYVNNYLMDYANFWLNDSYKYSPGRGNYNYGKNASYVYNYFAGTAGTISWAGASKDQTYGSTDYYSTSITTVKKLVRPTIQLKNPQVSGGNGSSSNPYIINTLNQ